MRFLLFLVLGYALVLAAAYFGQRRLLYVPSAQRPPATTLESFGLELWPTAGGYRGVIGSAPPEPAAGTVVVFHGNGGAAWQRSYYLAALAPLGYRVVLAEYPRYGGRPGSLGERSYVADARDTVRLAHQAFGGPLVLWGESLGAGVAAAVAADPPAPIAGVVLVTPWDSLTALARARYPFLPVRWLLRDRYDSAANLSAFPGPVAVLPAEHDEVIPLRHARNLYDSLPGPKLLFTFEGAGHNSWPPAPSEAWWRKTMDFVTSPNPEP